MGKKRKIYKLKGGIHCVRSQSGTENATMRYLFPEAVNRRLNVTFMYHGERHTVLITSISFPNFAFEVCGEVDSVSFFFNALTSNILEAQLISKD